MVFSCADLERGSEGRALDEALCWGEASSWRYDSWPALRARLRCLPPLPSRILMCKFPRRHLSVMKHALNLHGFLLITSRIIIIEQTRAIAICMHEARRGSYVSCALMAFLSVSTALSPVHVLAFSTSFISSSFCRLVTTAVFLRCTTQHAHAEANA